MKRKRHISSLGDLFMVFVSILAFLVYILGLLVSAYMLNAIGRLENVDPEKKWVPVVLGAMIITASVIAMAYAFWYWVRKSKDKRKASSSEDA